MRKEKTLYDVAYVMNFNKYGLERNEFELVIAERVKALNLGVDFDDSKDELYAWNGDFLLVLEEMDAEKAKFVAERLKTIYPKYKPMITVYKTNTNIEVNLEDVA